jgi:phosphohistidine phosphatase
MDLILWRHAEAEDGFPDMDRELTPKGIKQARQMAAWLKPRLPEKLQILVSPARRTLQTAEALNLDFTMCEDVAPGATAQSLLAAANWPHAGHDVLVIGHQPTLGEVAASLLAGQNRGWSIRKGAVWWFAGNTRDGLNACTLKAVMTAEMSGEKHR